MEWPTRLLAEFDDRNKVGGVDGWTILSQAIFRGRVTLKKPSFVSCSDCWVSFLISVNEDGESSVDCPRNRCESNLVSLLNFMELLGDPPEYFCCDPPECRWLLPENAELATRGKLLREQLPSYLVQQRAAVVAHCPLPTVLQAIVAAYAAPTPADMWTDGLRIQAPGEKRAHVAADVDQADGGLPRLRRSLRLQQK
jgi:hypothetical protein